MPISKSAASRKGKSAERKVRDEIRRIYPPELRDKVQRVPMSGASWMKGDVIDLNDTSIAIEVKNQENLQIPAWWRQTIAQAQTWQTPVLVFTSNHRPFYWVMREDDWVSFAEDTLHGPQVSRVKGSTRDIYNKLYNLVAWDYLVIEVEGEKLAVIANEDYITVKKEIYDDLQRTRKA